MRSWKQLFQPILNVLQKTLTNKFAPPDVLLSSFIQRALTGQERADPISHILRVLTDLTQAQGATLLLNHHGQDAYVLKKSFKVMPFCCAVEKDFALCRFLRNHPRVLTRRMLIEDRRYDDIRSTGLRYFTEFQCDLVIPLTRGPKLYGLVNLGKKDNGQEFTSAECSTLSTLGFLMANEIQNAMLIAEVQDQNVRLSELDALKNQLLTNVTHELRTPLNGILGLTEAILEEADGPVSEDQRRHLEMVLSAGQSLLEMVNNILDLSKMESNQMALNVKRTDMGRLVSEVCQLFEGITRARQVSLGWEVDKGLASVFMDEDRIRQVLMNLIGNAIKFTRNGTVNVVGERHGDVAKVCVSDTGIGVRDEDREIIFQAFRQADSTSTREFSGTGLGLTLAKRIVELHGGRIWHENNAEQGSNFYFTLPLRPGYAKPVAMDKAKHETAMSEQAQEAAL